MQGLGRFLSCEAHKPEKIKKDLLIIVDVEPQHFFMTYKYFLTVVSKLSKAIYRRTGVQSHGYRCVKPTLYLLSRHLGIKAFLVD